jgi:hypothetical protein
MPTNIAERTKVKSLYFKQPFERGCCLKINQCGLVGDFHHRKLVSVCASFDEYQALDRIPMHWIDVHDLRVGSFGFIDSGE